MEVEMGITNGKDIQSMDDLFVHTLRDIYYAENKLVQSIPKMAALASDPELKNALHHHLEETHQQVSRLEDVFRLRGIEPSGVDCPAIDGIVKEADEVTADVGDVNVRDAAIIAMAQAVEHYEITRYGTLIAWAKELGYDECATLLTETLREEVAADEKLTDVAETRVNQLAA